MGKVLSCFRPSSPASPSEGRSAPSAAPSGAGDGASHYCIEPSGKAQHGLYVVIVLDQLNNQPIWK